MSLNKNLSSSTVAIENVIAISPKEQDEVLNKTIDKASITKLLGFALKNQLDLDRLQKILNRRFRDFSKLSPKEFSIKRVVDSNYFNSIPVFLSYSINVCSYVFDKGYIYDKMILECDEHSKKLEAKISEYAKYEALLQQPRKELPTIFYSFALENNYFALLISALENQNFNSSSILKEIKKVMETQGAKINLNYQTLSVLVAYGMDFLVEDFHKPHMEDLCQEIIEHQEDINYLLGNSSLTIGLDEKIKNYLNKSKKANTCAQPSTTVISAFIKGSSNLLFRR